MSSDRPPENPQTFILDTFIFLNLRRPHVMGQVLEHFRNMIIQDFQDGPHVMGQINMKRPC